MTYREDIKKVASLVELPWSKLDGCNILVTGATGLIGSCLVKVLMAHHGNYHVYASVRNESRAKKIFEEFSGDEIFHIIKYDVTGELHSSIDFQYIIHAASYAGPSFFANNPVEVMKANFNGVCNLLDYGKSHNLKRFLFVSTGEVYGEGDGREFTEDYSGYVNTMSPRSCYPSSKRTAETLCISYEAEYGLDVVIARPCHVYGPQFTASDNRVYAQFIRNVLRGEDIVMKSTGEQYRSWCYVVDCVSALLYILMKGKSGEAYNIADSSANITIGEMAKMIAEIGGKKVVIDIPSNKEKAGYNVVQQSLFSTSKLESLGWTIIGTMKDKIKKTIKDAKLRELQY